MEIFSFFIASLRIISTGRTVNANVSIIRNSLMFNPNVLNVEPPKYSKQTWTTIINIIMNMKGLFLVMFANILMRLVRALNEFKTPENTNSPKKAVIRYLLSIEYLKMSFNTGSFRKIINRNAV